MKNKIESSVNKRNFKISITKHNTAVEDGKEFAQSS